MPCHVDGPVNEVPVQGSLSQQPVKRDRPSPLQLGEMHRAPLRPRPIKRGVQEKEKLGNVKKIVVIHSFILVSSFGTYLGYQLSFKRDGVGGGRMTKSKPAKRPVASSPFLLSQLLLHTTRDVTESTFFELESGRATALSADSRAEESDGGGEVVVVFYLRKKSPSTWQVKKAQKQNFSLSCQNVAGKQAR